jgi:hypothetical protein
MRLFLKRLLGLFRGLGTGWSILGVTLLLVALGEVGLRGLFWLKDRGRPLIPPDPRVVAAIDGSSAWLPAHYRELEALSDRWEPFVYFRQRPFRGQTITIGEDGLRATWRPPLPDWTAGSKSRPTKLLMLGGSSLWGFGARDDATIPSLVARGLHDRGIEFELRNLAEIGYVNTQELVALARELQRGYRPDLVLFYDGVNDTTSALLERQAAVTTNEVNRVREFNLLQSPSRLASALGMNLIRNSGWYRLAGSIGRRVSGAQRADHIPLVETELAALARDVVRRYAANVKLIEALAQAYGFRPLFVWQPVVFSKSNLTAFEREESEKFGWTKDLFQRVHEELRSAADLSSDPAFCDLSEVFQQSESLVFLDFCHTTEAANESIAGRLVERLIPMASMHHEALNEASP